MNSNDQVNLVVQRFNSNRTKWCFEVEGGFACYRGGVDRQGRWRGKLIGVARDSDQVDRFFEGSTADLDRVSFQQD